MIIISHLLENTRTLTPIFVELSSESEKCKQSVIPKIYFTLYNTTFDRYIIQYVSHIYIYKMCIM